MNEAHERLREAVREAYANFPGEYWRELDAKREYPEEFVRAMTRPGTSPPSSRKSTVG